MKPILLKNAEFRSFVKKLPCRLPHLSLNIFPGRCSGECDSERKEILKTVALNEGKPEKVIDKIVEGRIEKFFKDVCLSNSHG